MRKKTILTLISFLLVCRPPYLTMMNMPNITFLFTEPAPPVKGPEPEDIKTMEGMRARIRHVLKEAEKKRAQSQGKERRVIRRVYSHLPLN